MPTENVIAESEDFAYAVDAREDNSRFFRNWKNLETQYLPWLSVYKSVATFVAPGRGRFIDQESNPNQKTDAFHKIINPVAPDALHMLGAGLHGGLSSPARPWFQLEFEDPGLNKYSVARDWLDECEKILYAVFKKSNFYNLIHNVYEEVGAFGTGAFFIDSHPSRVVNFNYLTAGDYRFAINQFNLCQSLYRKFRLQVQQMADMFGVDHLSSVSKNLLEKNPYQWRDVLHLIEPNDEYDPEGISSSQMKYRSVYVEVNEPVLRLSESGYHEMPFVTPRWMSRSHETYGWGPGIEALGLSKAIQRMEQNSMLAEDKYLDPPLGIISGYKDRMIDLSPGAKNHFKDGDDARKAFVPLVQIDGNAIQLYEQKIASTENKIRRLFFYELFLMISQEDKRMTATEVAVKQEEKMIMLGPTIEALLYEQLDPIMERVFNLCARAGKLPPPPKEIEDTEYKVTYISILAQAQKLIQSQGMNVYRAAAGEVAAINPESIDKTDWDAYLENMGDMLNVPSNIIREQDEVDQLRKARAEEAARQQEIIEDQTNADTMQKLGKASVNPETALGQLQRSMGAPE
jgi:hypothetical protein